MEPRAHLCSSFKLLGGHDARQTHVRPTGQGNRWRDAQADVGLLEFVCLLVCLFGEEFRC